MDQATLVIDKIAEARKLIDELNRQGGLIFLASFWMDDIEFDRWSLYLVTPTIDQVGMNSVYVAIIKTLENHPEIHVDLDQIVPSRPDNAIVREVLGFIENYPEPKATRPNGIYLKGHFVERAYIYPIDLE